MARARVRPPLPPSVEGAGGPGPSIAELARGDGFVPSQLADLTGVEAQVLAEAGAGAAGTGGTATASVALADAIGTGVALNALGALGAAATITEASGLGELVAGADLNDAKTAGANPYPLGTDTHRLWAAGLASGDPQGPQRPAPDRQELLVAYLRGVFAHKVLVAVTATGAPPPVPTFARPHITPGAFGGLRVGLVPFAGALVVVGLIYSLRALVAIVGGIVSTASRPIPFVGDWTARRTRDATHYTAGVLGQAASALDPLAAAFWQDAAKLTSWLWQEVTGQAALIHAHSHALSATATSSQARRPSPWAQGRTRAVAAGMSVAGAARLAPVLSQVTQLRHELETTHKRLDLELGHALPARLAGLHEQAHHLQTQLAAQQARHAELEKMVTAGGGAALFAAGAAAIGADWLKCRNWRNLGRKICGIPGGILNDLLALALDFAVLESICVVLPWLEAAASEIGVPLVEGLAAVVDAGTCGGAARGPALAVPRLYLPAPTPIALSLPA